MGEKDLEKLFEEKPYLKRMGAQAIATRFNIPIKDIWKMRKKKKHQKKNDVRILIFDIETSPMRAYVWSR